MIEDYTSLFILLTRQRKSLILTWKESMSERPVRWLVKFNKKKKIWIITFFSRRINSLYLQTLFSNYIPIQEVLSHKNLGLFLSKSLWLAWSFLIYIGKGLVSFELSADNVQIQPGQNISWNCVFCLCICFSFETICWYPLGQLYTAAM